MFRPLAALTLCLGASTNVLAQATARDSDLVTLRSAMMRATKAYEAFNVEGARPLLAMVVARRDILPAVEVAAAYKLLGATWAVLARPDSARVYYTEALRLDPTMTLDPTKFSASELAPFNDAKRMLTTNYTADTSAAGQTATLRIGSPVPEAFFYVDDRVTGPISTFRSWTIPAGRPVHITIRSTKCAVPWDTVVVATAGSTVTIGRRSPTGCK